MDGASYPRSVSVEIRAFAPHLISLVTPLTSLVFVLTGPHSWWIAPVFSIPVYWLAHLDSKEFDIRYDSDVPHRASFAYDILLYTQSFLHILVIYQLMKLFSRQIFFSIDMYFVPIVIANSSRQLIVTAHELIHRRIFAERQIGRFLMCLVLYEHFFTEHVRGHHVRVGTVSDPATARFGETFSEFWKRSVPAQLRSAWHIERRRLRKLSVLGGLVRNRVIQGWTVEALLIVGIVYTFGWTSLAAFVIQAYLAVRGLEAVNYLEHWGLQRANVRVHDCDSWDSNSWCSRYLFGGLARHADHHAHPDRKYQNLRIANGAPRLPGGYLAATHMAMYQNKSFMEAATAELRRLKLGPFAGGLQKSESTIPSRIETREGESLLLKLPRAAAKFWRERIPALYRWLLINTAIVIACSISDVLQSRSFFGSLSTNSAIFIFFLAFLFLQQFLGKRLNPISAATISPVILAMSGPVLNRLIS